MESEGARVSLKSQIGNFKLAPEESMARSELNRPEAEGNSETVGTEMKDEDSSYGSRGEEDITVQMKVDGSSSEPVSVLTSDSKTDTESKDEAPWFHSDSPCAVLEEGPRDADRWSHGFEIGDMVWGKVKSHPWWPGHIYNEAFASSSVRRSRRTGHVLVAFFGDSSYGWFDPAELVHFDPHYTEKSRQTNSRNFMKAVEEAVDEAGRRKALGLVCRCRKPFNFRPTSVNGYFVVDVDEYEPGGVYSSKQIKKARDSFCPSETLSFVQGLALRAQCDDEKTIDWIKNMATVLAYRKAVYEEFDETYAQAFGMDPVRPAQTSLGELEKLDKAPPRAPLSGPLVMAEALGEKKSSSKHVKVRELTKKDKYLFKRRDEHNEQGVVQANIVPSGDFILQKRAPTVGHENIILTQEASRKESDLIDNTFVASKLAPLNTDDNVPLVDDSAVAADDLQTNWPLGYVGVAVVEGDFVDGDARPALLDPGMAVPQMTQPTGTSPSAKPSTSSGIADIVVESGDGAKVPTMLDSVEPTNSDVVTAKMALKRPLEDLASDSSPMGEKKGKKKKKNVGFETDPDHPHKRPKTIDGELLRKKAGKSIGIGSSTGVHPQIGSPRQEDGVGSALISSIDNLSQSIPDDGNIEFPQLVQDLLALALDPFYGFKRNSQAAVRDVFLRFRSLVYQKSLVLQPASEPENSEKTMRESAVGTAKIHSGEEIREQSSSKLSKHPLRPDDPAKVGRKHGQSERLEEMSAKRLKKLHELKALTTEKKAAGQKALDGQKVERKENTGASNPAKPVKLDSVKKPDTASVKAAEPTSLMMFFPPGAKLPSAPQLKARFARFGPLDLSGTRLFWKSSSCRVVFKHKSDALAAYSHGMRNALFGYMKVNYQLRDYEVPGQVPAPTPQTPEMSKQRAEDGSSETPPVRFAGGDAPADLRSTHQQRAPGVQLKSILKKPSVEDMVSGSSVVKEGPRVKFMLVGGDSSSSKGEPVAVVNSNSSSGSGSNNGTGDVSPFTASLDVNNITSKNVKSTMVMAPLLPTPSLIPLPVPPRIPFDATTTAPQISSDVTTTTTTTAPLAVASSNESRIGSIAHFPEPQPQRSKQQFREVEARKESADISHQMLSLMLRCSDIVTNVKCSLGYVPYHPL